MDHKLEKLRVDTGIEACTVAWLDTALTDAKYVDNAL